jgi:hypothetical protein
MHAVGRWILGKKNCCVKRGEGEDNNEVLREIRDTCHVCTHTYMYVCMSCVYTRDYYSSSFLSTGSVVFLKKTFF